MVRKYTIIVEKDEDGWLVSEVIGFPGCHTQAKDMNQLIERTKEAIRAYLKTEEEPELSKEAILVIEKARKRIKSGSFITEEEARKRLSLFY